MNLAQAKAALSRPLIFGDAEQIEACDYIHQLGVIKRKMQRCRFCGGRGYREIGKRKVRRACSCVASFDPHMIAEAERFKMDDFRKLVLEVGTNGTDDRAGTKAAI